MDTPKRIFQSTTNHWIRKYFRREATYFHQSYTQEAGATTTIPQDDEHRRLAKKRKTFEETILIVSYEN